MDAAQQFRLRIVQQFVLHRFNLLSQRLHHLEIVVDDAVHQPIQEIIGSRLPDPPFTGAQPLPHRIEDVPAILLERQHEGRAQDQADLLYVDVLAPLAGVTHFQHDVVIRLVVVEFGALVGIDDVLK